MHRRTCAVPIASPLTSAMLGCWVASVASSDPYLLHSRQALELGAAEVLLLEGGRLQHEMLLLRRVHLLQVLSCGAGRAM